MRFVNVKGVQPYYQSYIYLIDIIPETGTFIIPILVSLIKVLID